MTLSSETVKVSYSGNGATTAFPITFIFWAETDILAVLRNAAGAEATWVNGTNYTLTGGDGATGTLTAIAAPASGETLVIKSNRAETQPTDFPLGGEFPSTNAERAIDQTVRLIQQRGEELDRTLKFAITDPVAASLPALALLKGKTLGFNSSTGAPEGVTPSNSSATSVTATGTSTARTMADRASDVVNVLDYGAAGDGVTDDTAAFVAALATLRSVYVPFGSYKVTTNSLRLGTAQTLYGDGMDSTVITSFSTTGSILTIGGTGTLTQYPYVRDLLIKFDTSVARSAGQRTIRVSNAAYFSLDRVDMLNGLINFCAEDCLIYALNDCYMRNGEVNCDLVPSAAYYSQHNLVQFSRCHFNSATLQAVRADGGGALEFNQVNFHDCHFEGNGTNGSGLNVVYFDNVGVTGVAPGVGFYNCWFETNRGLRDLYLAGANTSTSFAVIDCGFFSTLVATANLEITQGIVRVTGCGLNVTGPTWNITLGAFTSGYAIGNKVALLSNSGEVVTNIGQYTVRTTATLVPAGSTTPGSPTHTTSAKASKNGKRVTVDFECSITNLSTMAGDFRLTGLPYASINDGVAAGGGVVWQFDGVNLAAGGTNLSVKVPNNVTYAEVYYSIDAGASKRLPIAELTATVVINGSFSYDAAA